MEWEKSKVKFSETRKREREGGLVQCRFEDRGTMVADNAELLCFVASEDSPTCHDHFYHHSSAVVLYHVYLLFRYNLSHTIHRLLYIPSTPRFSLFRFQI